MSYDEFDDTEDGFRMSDTGGVDEEEMTDFGLDEEDPESRYS